MEVQKAVTAEEAITLIKRMEENNSWYSNPEADASLMVAKRLRQTKHGLYSSVPIICRAETCPYAEACELVQMNIAPFGEKCPMEIAAMEDLFMRYCRELDVDPSDPEQQIDSILIKEVVDIDISLLRCDKKMAINADFIIDNIVGFTDDGDALVKKELHPLTDYKERLRNQKYKTLNLLDSTRKDKKGNEVNVTLSSSERAAQLIQIQEAVVMNDESEDKAKEEYFEKMKRLSGEQPIQIIDVEGILEEGE